MKKWTFLLQKDGDRSWLPLGSAALAVEEGRYRIVAQTEHPNADISIRICHLATTEDPPKRRIQKRSNRTNRNGLMVVTPFTRLQPGDWEFSCFLTDPMSELIGDMVHQAVRLQVAPSSVTGAIAAAPAAPEVSVPPETVCAPTDCEPTAEPAGSPIARTTSEPTPAAAVVETVLEPVTAEIAPPIATETVPPAIPLAATPVHEPVDPALPVVAIPMDSSDRSQERRDVIAEPDASSMVDLEDVWATPVEEGMHAGQPAAAIAPLTPDESPIVEPAVAAASPEDQSAPEPSLLSPAIAHEADSLNVEIAQSLGVSMDRLVAMTDQLSHQLIEEIFREFNLPVVVEPATATPEPVEETIAPSALPRVDVRQVAIALAQDSWIVATGESLEIAGELRQTDVMDDDVAIADGLEVALDDAIPQELQVQFRDPQTSQVLFQARQSFPQGELPLAFTFPFQLPADLSTHLLLGEVLIVGTLPGAETAAITLKSVTFTVTVDPQGLVDELQKVKTALAAAADEPEELPDLVMQFSSRLQREKQRPLLDLSFLNLAAPMPESTPPEPVAAVADPQSPATAKPRSVLPPQLYQRSAEPSSAEQPSKRKLELPVFAGAGTRSQAGAIAGQSTAVAVAEPVSAPDDTAFGSSVAELQAMVLADGALELSDPPTPLPATGWAPDEVLPPSPASPAPINPDGAIADAGSETEGFAVESTGEPASFAELEALLHQVNLDPERTQAPSQPPAHATGTESVASPDRDRMVEDLARLDELMSPVRSAFQALNLQDKFLDRLSSLASDAELATLLKLTLPTDADPEPDTTPEEPVPTATHQVNPLPLNAVITEPETTEVVVDDDPTWRAWVKRAGVRTQAPEPAIDSATTTLVLPVEQPIPVPELDITPVELVAGKTMNLRVRLPNLLPKIYVKLWIHDRQTRSLLDGPRWLVNLSPNGFDELEATTQLLVPMGSLQIRLEAIAVEMHTQRESQKVGLDFDVMPPDLPEDPFAGLDL